MPELTVWVPGVPQPQGSARAFKRGNKVIVTSDNTKLRPWRDALRWHLQSAHRGAAFGGEVALELDFCFPRPAGHYGVKGLRPSAPLSHTVRPDLDKLCRAVLDALTESGVIRDDAQVVQLDALKQYARAGQRPLSPGVQIVLSAAQPRQESQPSIPAQEQAHGSTAGIRRVVG